MKACADFYASHGLTDPDFVAKVKGCTGYYSDVVPAVPRNYRRMMDGNVIHIGGSGDFCHGRCGRAFAYAVVRRQANPRAAR